MSAIAQSRSSATLSIPSATHRNGWHTTVLATAATLAGALVLGAAMTLSMLLAGSMPSTNGVPSSQPMPQPSAESGLDR
jgi:hypothetical protein